MTYRNVKRKEELTAIPKGWEPILEKCKEKLAECVCEKDTFIEEK